MQARWKDATLRLAVSSSDPLMIFAAPSARPAPRLSVVPVPRSAGRLALTACPGRTEPGERARDALTADIACMAAQGVRLVVSLLTTAEMRKLGIGDLRAATAEAGLGWVHAPIDDFAPPDAAFDSGWESLGPLIHAHLDQGETVLIHCRAGLGRSGTIAALILIERGMTAAEAIDHVRRHRRGAIETAEQERYLNRKAQA
jgi:ADP-ribosyl-[dinitrogen reductase] hydrolase